MDKNQKTTDQTSNRLTRDCFSENLPGMDVYVTHQMNPDTFAAILRLSGQKKKGKGKKK